MFYHLTMNRHIERNSAFLRRIYYSEARNRKHLIETAELQHIIILSMIARKILKGHINISLGYKEKLKEYKTVMRTLASRRVSNERKRRTLATQHRILPLLIQPILHMLPQN